MIIGIDEVGRGAWAGPVTVGAVALGSAEIDGLTDSKKLTIKRRLAMERLIKQQAAQASLGWVAANTIDRIGLSAALKLAIERALAQLEVKAEDQIIIDGTINFLKGTEYEPQTVTMKQADLLVPSVSAASVLAKVARDSYMALCDSLFGGYGFAAHVGYGTLVHRQALAEQGACPLHRRSFGPLKSVAASTPVKALSTSGQLAEAAAANYLQSRGYRVIERNWKTKWCEIDIIAEKNGDLHFVEVKYRQTAQAGDGLDAITDRKQRQMRYAAEFWLHAHPARTVKGSYLSAISLSSQPIEVDRFIARL